MKLQLPKYSVEARRRGDLGRCGSAFLTLVGLKKRARRGQGEVVRMRKKTKGMESTMLKPSRGQKENPGPSASVSR